MEQDTDFRGQAASTPTISLSIDEPAYPIQENFAVTLDLDTANQPIDSVNIHLEYDPELLEAISIKTLEIFSNQEILDKSIDHTQGLVHLSIAPQSGSKPTNVAGPTAVIVFKGIQPAKSTAIDFLPQTNASLSPNSQSILTTKIPAAVALRP